MLREKLKQFRDEEDGVVAVELLLVMPILVWALLSTFVYFDMFRTESNSHRAALTMADMFSREQTALDATYLNGARELLRTLTYAEDNPDYRITVYSRLADDSDYEVRWSENRGMGSNLTTADLQTLAADGRIPILAPNDRAILLQTRVEYSPPFSIGLAPFSAFTGAEIGDVTFSTFTVIRPRFTPSLCLEQPAPQADIC